jgi:hypothetical protein
MIDIRVKRRRMGRRLFVTGPQFHVQTGINVPSCERHRWFAIARHDGRIFRGSGPAETSAVADLLRQVNDHHQDDRTPFWDVNGCPDEMEER